MAKIALVTGGSRGIGAETCRTLASEGWDVAFTYRENQSSADQVVSAIEEHGQKALALQADVSDFNRAHEVIEETVSTLGGIHALICNAGIAASVPLSDMTEEQWDSVIDVSLKGAFNYMRAAAPHFSKQKEGKIVCVSSINAARGRPGTASYNAAKAGLEGLVRTAAAELGEEGVNVNAVAPGFVETKLTEDYPAGRKEEILEACAIKRLGQPADIAPVICFLCSDAACHITGEVITVDAGQSLARPLRS